MKKIVLMAAAVAGIVLTNPALAHGAKAKHGGVVASAADLAFELVARDGKALIYIEDHGRALSTSGASGTLTVLQGTNKSASTLEPAGDNTLATREALKLAKGSKAVASITLPGKDALSVRFSVK